MNLRKADLPPQVIEALLGFNIRDVETLLSIVAVPNGAIAVAKVLGTSLESVQKMASALRVQFPDLKVDPVSDVIHPMGHRPPVRNAT